MTEAWTGIPAADTRASLFWTQWCTMRLTWTGNIAADSNIVNVWISQLNTMTSPNTDILQQHPTYEHIKQQNQSIKSNLFSDASCKWLSGA